MKYLIVMRVIDRSPKVNYIHMTMKSLISSGLFRSKIPFEFHLFDGGSSCISYLNQYRDLKNLFVHKTEYKITRNENWLRSVGYINYTKHQYVIQLEDDLLFCDKWLESIDAYITKHQGLIDNNPMTSFYAAYKEIERRTKRKIEHWPGTYQQFYGTQCVLFKRDIALKVVKYIRNSLVNFDNYDFKFRKKGHVPHGMKGACIDLWLQEWGEHEYPHKSFILTCPSFVQHIGAAEGKHLHQSHFLGEQWSYIRRGND
jgi:hypothetical protein